MKRPQPLHVTHVLSVDDRSDPVNDGDARYTSVMITYTVGGKPKTVRAAICCTALLHDVDGDDILELTFERMPSDKAKDA